MKRTRIQTFAAAAVALGFAGIAAAETPDNPGANMAGLIESMQEVVKTDNEDVSTRLRLASMLYEIGQVEEADALMAEAAALDPNIGQYLDPLADGCEDCDRGTGGPDVIVGDLNGVANYGTSSLNGESYAAFAVGTTSCNIGDEILDWFPNTNVHPVIGQNMFRYKDGRFEQIGQSHLKHGFCALQQNLCGSCTPVPGSCPPQLGVGCSDPYSSGLNGQQSRLGPKWQVNAYTGAYPMPYQAGSYTNSTLGRRLQVNVDDLNPDLNDGASYFVEGQYVQPQDATAGNGLNNASYRPVNVFPSGSNYLLSFSGSTVRTKSAIFAWEALDSEVEIIDVDVPNEGRFHVGYRVYDNGDGTWTYEYAIRNLNSDRSGREFSIDVPDFVNVTDMGFHDVRYHSGDGINGNTFDGTDWDMEHANGQVSWSTQTFDENDNANALRWGTQYNFRFTANVGPAMRDASIGLFKPGEGDSVAFEVSGPCALTADTNGDSRIDFEDLNVILNNFSDTGEGLPGDIDGDGEVNFSDLNTVLNQFGGEC